MRDVTLTKQFPPFIARANGNTAVWLGGMANTQASRQQGGPISLLDGLYLARGSTLNAVWWRLPCLETLDDRSQSPGICGASFNRF